MLSNGQFDPFAEFGKQTPAAQTLIAQRSTTAPYAPQDPLSAWTCALG